MGFPGVKLNSFLGQGQRSIEQGDIESGQPNLQDNEQVTLSFETISQHEHTWTIDLDVVCFGMVYE
jgi:hypothetical protein